MIRPPVDYPIPNAPQMPIAKAERMARVERLRGRIEGAGWVFALVGGIAFGASIAFGETITIGGNAYVHGGLMDGTTVTLAPSAEPGQLATVTLVNEHVNDGNDTGTYFLGIEGLVVEVEFTWDRDPIIGSDAITVIPPEGIECLPADCSVTVLEGFTGEVVLLDWVGM